MTLHLISCPRTISTALMYSFAQREDTFVIDEPFYAYYLNDSGSIHPGREEILAAQSSDFTTALDGVKNASKKAKYVFVKNMAHHLKQEHLSAFYDMPNVFLLRDPKSLIVSFSKVIPKPTMRDIGMKQQWEYFEHLQKHSNTQPIVLLSEDTLADARGQLQKLCQAIDIPFYESMLHWEAGAMPQDGVWAKYWYSSVHKSTGFINAPKKEVELAEHLKHLYDEAMVYYNQLLKYKI